MATGKGATMHQHNDYKVQQEFERVNKAASKVSETISFQQGNGGRGGSSTNVTNNTNITNEPTLWALTIQKNSVTQVAPNDKKKIQVINFQDNTYNGKTFDCYITWEMTKESPSPDFLTIPDGLRISIKAKGKISVVEMLNEIKTYITQIVSGDMSIVNDHTTEYPKLLLKLENDEDSPGANEFYGTDINGDKGWQDLSSVVGDSHTHANKDDLDNYDPDNFAAYSHTHIGLLPTGTVTYSILYWNGTNWVANGNILANGSKFYSKGSNYVESVLTNDGGTAYFWAARADQKHVYASASASISRLMIRNNTSYVDIYNNELGQTHECFCIKERDGAYGTPITKFLVSANGSIMSSIFTASKLVATNASKELVSTDLFALSGGSVVKMLTADDSITEDTTLTAVSDFTQALLASSKYRVTAKLIVNQGGDVADFKMQFAVPSGSFIGSYKVLYDGTNTEVKNFMYNDLTASTNITMDTLPSGYYYVEIEGIADIGVTAGNFTFSFAQVNSAVPATILKKYSIIEMTKI